MLLLCFTNQTAAQAEGDPSHNYDFQEPLYTMMDVAATGVVAGWSGNCNTGRLPIAVTLWRYDATQLTATGGAPAIPVPGDPDDRGASRCGRVARGDLRPPLRCRCRPGR